MDPLYGRGRTRTLRPVPKFQVPQDPFNHRGVADQAEDLEWSGAAGTDQGIRFVHFLDQPGPRTPAAARELVAAVGSSGQTTAGAELPLVWVLSTGGTIAGKGASSTSLTDYKGGSISGEQLVATVPEIKQIATVKVEQITNVGSSNLTIQNWLTLANRINAILREEPKVSGVVVTHGTNTQEETDYFLNLTLHRIAPWFFWAQ